MALSFFWCVQGQDTCFRDSADRSLLGDIGVVGVDFFQDHGLAVDEEPDAGVALQRGFVLPALERLAVTCHRTERPA